MAWLADFSTSLDNIFEKTIGPSARKQGRREQEPSGAAASSPPFNDTQSDWLKNAMGAALSSFGQHVEQRFVQQDEKLTAIETQVNENTKNLVTLNANAMSTNESVAQLKSLSDEVAALKRALADRPAAQHAPGASSSSPVSPPTAPATRIARIGNLGWNDPSQVIEERALQVLDSAGVPRDSYKHLVAVSRDKGSCCECEFVTTDGLAAARIAVRKLAKSFRERSIVWVDEKKSREAMRPARRTHRAFEALTDLIKESHPEDVIEKNLRGKFLTHGSNRVGFSFNGAWRWTSYAQNRYSSDILDMVKGFAESE